MLICVDAHKYMSAHKKNGPVKKPVSIIGFICFVFITALLERKIQVNANTQKCTDSIESNIVKLELCKLL